MSEYATYSAANIPFTVPRNGGYRFGSDIENMDDPIVPSDPEVPKPRGILKTPTRTRDRANTWQASSKHTSNHTSPIQQSQHHPSARRLPKRSRSLLTTSSYPTYQACPPVGYQPISTDPNMYFPHQPGYHLPIAQNGQTNSNIAQQGMAWPVVPQQLSYPQQQQHQTPTTQHYQADFRHQGNLGIRDSLESIFKLPLEGITNAEMRFLVISVEGLILLLIVHLLVQLLNSVSSLLPLIGFIAGAGYVFINVTEHFAGSCWN